MSTMTRSTGIRCGHCRGRHASVAQVRECFGGANNSTLAATTVFERDAEAMMAYRAQRDLLYPGTTPNTEHLRYAGSENGHEPHTAGYQAQRSWGREATPELKDGIYRNPQTGDIFKVYRTVHGANQKVAKRLQLLDQPYTKISRGKEVEVRAEFIYAGKAGLRGLTPEMQMTLEDAKKYGALYGVCIRCCRTLTREESIERSMGQVCANKENWA